MPTRARSAASEVSRTGTPSTATLPSLRDFSLAVEPGETVAIVGPSGAGKSTVFQLLLRFYDVASGSVSVDGVPVKDVSLDDLRERIGIVPQDSVIFSADAMENIRYGKPSASDEEVICASKAAFALMKSCAKAAVAAATTSASLACGRP